MHAEPRPSATAAGDPPDRSAATADEAAWLARIAAGDRGAFEALYRAYFPRLTRFLERVVRRPHAIEEVLNDAMLVVWNRAASYNGRSKVSTWIFGIAYRKALKAAARFDDPVESGDEDLESAPVETEPEDRLMQRQLSDAIDGALGQLPATQRAVVELTIYHGCPYREIADIMGCPVDTVKTRMFHARRRLRLLLERDGRETP